MAINKQTIISVYNEKLTLLQWLKTVNQALDAGTLTGIEVSQKGNATFTFVITFEDGTFIESNEFILNKGDSVSHAYIEDGHLYIELTNEEVVDAGDIKPVSSFAFDASRHLIVYYEDGTNQDLGLIKGVDHFALDANKHLIVYYDNDTNEDLGAVLSGEYDLSGLDVIAKTFSQSDANYTKELNVTSNISNVTATESYYRFIVINNVAHIILNAKLTNNTSSDIVSKHTNAFLIMQANYIDTIISSKIIDMDGAPLSQNTGTDRPIAISNFGVISNSPVADPLGHGTFVLYRGGTNYIRGVFKTFADFTIPANSSVFVSARIALTLL